MTRKFVQRLRDNLHVKPTSNALANNSAVMILVLDINVKTLYLVIIYKCRDNHRMEDLWDNFYGKKNVSCKENYNAKINVINL